MRFLLSALLLCSGIVQAQTRITYGVKDTDTLYMDHYQPEGRANGMSIMFIHGGAFTGGDPVNQRPFAEGMCKRGYNIFVISYRLYLKGKDFGCNTETSEKLKAIRTAVDDAADAVRYILERPAALGVDTGKFFIAGSSAGAETVLQLLYNPFAVSDPARYDYFKRPRFRGAMVFAGALIDMNTMRQDNWVPTLFMHGTKDQLVPFGTAAHRFCRANSLGWLMMFGAKTIYEQAKVWKKPVVLYTYTDRGHEVSNYMFREFDKMDVFLKSVAEGRGPGVKEVVIPKE